MSNKRDAAHLIRELCTFMAFSKIRFLTMIGEIYEPLEMRIVLDQIIDPAQNKVRIEETALSYSSRFVPDSSNF